MITSNELAFITDHAYVPEHLPHYVTAISQTEPFLIENFVTHLSGTQLIFVGYPLRESFEESRLLSALAQAKSLFKPETISLIAPALPQGLVDYTPSGSDSYFQTNISELQIAQKTRNMLTRARREVSVSTGKFGREHQRLIGDFLRTHPVDHASNFIFRRIGEYARCDSALLFEARNARGDLVAFDIAEFGARQYAFYMFNFRSRKHMVPGVSDLLLAQIIEHAKTQGKRYINLGLGINAGISFFKKKWGATPFLSYISGVQELNQQPAWDRLFDQLSGL